jgi:hypothetical protein
MVGPIDAVKLTPKMLMMLMMLDDDADDADDADDGQMVELVLVVPGRMMMMMMMTMMMNHDGPDAHVNGKESCATLYPYQSTQESFL